MECRSSEHRHVVKSSHSRRRLLKAELVVVISNKNEIIIDSNRALRVVLGDFAYRTARQLEWLFEEDKDDDDDDGSLCAAVESSSPPRQEARCVRTTTRSEKAFCLSPSSAL